MRLCLTLVSAALLVSTANAADIPQKAVQTLQDNVFWVQTEHYGYGSGFWVNSQTMVTACHVVSNELPILPSGYELEVAEFVDVWDRANQNRYKMRVALCDTIYDIAVLKTVNGQEYESDYIPVHDLIPKQGKEVFGGGYPRGGSLIITHGHWEGVSKYSEGLYDVSAQISYGDSGSPLIAFYDGEWKVVGIRLRVQLENKTGSTIPHLSMAASGPIINTRLEMADDK